MFQKFGRGLTKPWGFQDLNDVPNFSLPEGLLQIAKTQDKIVIAPVVPVYKLGTAGADVTKGDPLYIGSEGKYFPLSSYSDKIDVVGVAYNSVSEGDNLLVIIFGVIDGFESLETGKRYYLDKDLNLTTDTLKAKLPYGIAISETEILIQLFSGGTSSSSGGGGSMFDLFESRLDYDSNGNIIYEGYAPPGTPEDYPNWLIIRRIYDSGGNYRTKIFANRDSDFNKVWKYRKYYDYFEVFSEYYEYDENEILTYKGKAIPGATSDSIGWVVAKNVVDEDGNTIELGYAEGDRDVYKNIWDNRASYNYEVGYIVLIEYDSTTGNVIYKGTSYAGKQTDKEVWTIEKYTYSGDTLISIGVVENSIWDNRASYTYDKYTYLAEADESYQAISSTPASPDDEVWTIYKNTFDENGNSIKMQRLENVAYSSRDTLDFTQGYCELYDYDENGVLTYIGKCQTAGQEEWKNIWRIEKYVIDASTGRLQYIGVANKNFNYSCVWALRDSYKYDESIIKIFDYDTDGKIIYEGHTTAGSKTSEPAFLIYAFDYDANNNLIAKKLPTTDPQEYNKVWDNRTTYF